MPLQMQHSLFVTRLGTSFATLAGADSVAGAFGQHGGSVSRPGTNH